MKVLSDIQMFELLTAETNVIAGGPDTPFGCIVGDITQMSAESLAAGAASARMFVTLPLLHPARYQPVRVRRRECRS